jgi:citrate synthase
MERPVNDSELLSAREAAGLLAVRKETLYAYVSRGLVRRVPDARRGRSLYFREDLLRLRARQQAHGGHGAVAAGALRWGEPVLDSALTEIAETGPRYRGHDALGLAEAERPFEAVAELLWSGALPEGRSAWPTPDPTFLRRATRLLPKGARPLEAMAVVVPTLALTDPGRHGVSSEAQLARARGLLRALAASLALPGSPERALLALRADGVARGLLVALGQRPRREATRALDRALVLCADHELNPSTFAARVAASTGADLYACVSAALAALSGPLHGGACDRVETLVAETSPAPRAGRALDERLRRGDAVPGFGHPLYPKGDPRARLLLRTAQALRSRSPELRTLLALADAMSERGREAPTLDAGLVGLASALGLPRGAAVSVFAIGRTAGWIAHALEQQAAGFVLRPRARYVGPRP